jgi:hypothetical protein
MLKNKKLIFTSAAILFAASVIVYASSGGITGRTLKTTTNGCSCHGPTATPDVTVTISGPDSVNIGQQVQYTLTITRASKTGAGLDIATRSGTLAAVSSNIHAANGELTHNSNIPLVSGSVTVTFSYTAPGAPTTDTLWATGLATNSDGNTSGDDWNWAPSKRVMVRIPFGITPISNQVPEKFELNQNYPNPFNPSTKFSFSLPKRENVLIKVYDIAGNEINTLVNGELNAGSYLVDWDSKNTNGNSTASGVYFYRLTTNSFTDTKKMILTR